MVKIASRKSLSALVDWLQIQTIEMEFIDIAHNILGIPAEHFNIENGKLQYYNYDCCHRFGDIRIYDYYEMPYTDKMIVLSGKACEWFREVWLKQKSLSFEVFMKNLLVYEDSIIVKRLDVAVDDFNQTPFFTPMQLTRICEKKQFVYGKSTVYLPYGNEQTGATLYLKPPTADDRLKFYDKQAELAKEQGIRKKDLPPQIRTEIAFRREKAQEFFFLCVNSDKTLLELCQGYLKEKVQFYSDKEFQVPLKKWKDFLGSVESFHISISKEKVGLYRKLEWFKYGGAERILKAAMFLVENGLYPKMLEPIDYREAKYSPELANELKKFVVLMNRADLIDEINDSIKETKKRSAQNGGTSHNI